MSGRGKLNSQQCKSVSARWLAARLQPCRRLNHAIVPCCSKITISLGHLLRHLICFWWPCGDVAIHMGYWISLCPAHSHSFCYVFFSSLSLSCSQTHTPNLYSWQIEIALIEPSMCVDSRDYLDDWSYLWACCFLEKHFELCLWDKADDVTSHIYYFSGAPLIHTNHIYCFCYCHSSLVLFFVQHFNRK